MIALRVALVAVLAAVLSVGLAVLGQRWLERPAQGVKSPEWQAAELRTLPDFSLPDLSGRAVASTEWAGQVVILHYWATWCPPCIRELPLLIGVQERLAGLVQIVGIAVDRAEDVQRFTADYPLNYPILIANPEAVALAKQLGNRLEGLPFTAVFDRRGRLVLSRAGEITAAELEAQLSALIPEADPVRPAEVSR